MVTLVLAYAILLFSSTILVTTASLGLFFGAYDAATLPYTYVLLMFFGPLVSLIVLHLNSRFTLTKSLLSIHVILLLSLVLLPLLLNRSANPILRFSLPIYLEVFIALTYTSFWNLLGRIYNLRQGKRLFPLLLSSEHLATIGAGLVASLFVARLGATNLFWLAVLCMVGAIAFLQTISRADGSKMEAVAVSDVRQARPSNLQTLIREPYVLLMLTVVTLYTISVIMVQNLSYAQAEIRFPTENGMATYIGIFMATYGVLGLTIQWIIAGRILDRFGVTVTLLAMPSGLFLIMLIFALVGSLNDAAPALFWLASGANMYSYAIDGPYTSARNVMLQPLSANLRTQAQTAALGIVYPLMTGFSGLLLVFLLDIMGLDSVQLSYVILITLALWFAVVAWFGRAYVGRLRQALQARRLSSLTPFRSSDQTSVSVLEEALQSLHPAAVLYALDRLGEVAPGTLAERLPGLLTYPDDGVRLATLRHIAALSWQDTPPGVETLLQSSSNPEVRAAALRTWYVVDSRLAGANLSELSRDSQPAVRQAALAIMCRHDDPDLRRQAWEAFAALAASPMAADRVLAAGAIGELGDRAASGSQSAQVLLALLADCNPDVRRAALVAAAETRLPAVWPAVIHTLTERSSRSLAANALVAGGEDALPFLRAVSQEPQQNPQLLFGIALVCGRIATPEAIAILEVLLEHPDSDVRRQALLGLVQSAQPAAQPRRTATQQAMHVQAEELAEIIAAQADLGDTREVYLAADSLEQRRRLGTDNLLLLLSFLYEPQTILSARNALQMGRSEEEKHAYAIELLDILLDHEDKALLLPLLHHLSPQQRLAKLQKRFPQAILGREDRLRRLLEDGAGGEARWTKICAIYALGLLQDVEAAEAITITGISGSDDSALVETVLNSLEQLDVPLESIAVNSALETAVAQWRGRERQAMTLLQKAESLKRASIFAHLPDNALEAVADLMNVVTADPHETLIHKDDPGNCLYVIVDGQLRVHEDGHIFDTLGPGDVTGEIALLDAKPCSASVTAVTGCRLLRLDQKPFYDLLADYPEVTRELLRLLSRRLRDRTADLVTQAPGDTAYVSLPAVVGQPGVRRNAVQPEALIALDKLYILKSIDYFDHINDTLLGQVAALLEEADLAGGEVLFHQGDPGYSLFIVTIGQVRIHIGERTLAYAGEGDVIGEMALLESEPRLASVTAVVPTRLLRLDQQVFFELLEAQPEVTRGIVKTLSGRQRDRLRELVLQIG